MQVVWETQVPYEHAIECSYDGPQEGPVLRGLQVRHYSKSVANNYGVFITVSPAVKVHGTTEFCHQGFLGAVLLA